MKYNIKHLPTSFSNRAASMLTLLTLSISEGLALVSKLINFFKTRSESIWILARPDSEWHLSQTTGFLSRRESRTSMFSALSRLSCCSSGDDFGLVLSRKELRVLTICSSIDFRFFKFEPWISALTTTVEKQ